VIRCRLFVALAPTAVIATGWGAGLAVGTAAVPTTVAAQQGTVQVITQKAKGLEGNLLGDPVEQRFAVYTPPAYGTGTGRYPVIYLLHGIADSHETWLNAFQIPAMLDRLIKSQTIGPVIVVCRTPVTATWAATISTRRFPGGGPIGSPRRSWRPWTSDSGPFEARPREP